jgi:hypothetical protein
MQTLEMLTSSSPVREVLMHTTPVPTADLADQYGDQLRVCDVQFTSYGAVRSFAGPVRTVSCRDDNALLHQLLRTPGEGCVVVVDGGASLHTTLFGDLMAARARGPNGLHAATRAALRRGATAKADRGMTVGHRGLKGVFIAVPWLIWGFVLFHVWA